MIEFIGKNDVSERQVGVLPLSRLEDLPHILSLPSQYFGLFLACDARRLSDHQLIDVARLLVRQGLAYICVWGPDCERVNDLFDFAIVENDPDETEKSVRLTTWLDKLSLEEAVWHFLNVAFPADQYKDNCLVELFITIGTGEWASEIRMWIADQHGLEERVVGKDDDETGV